MLWLPGIAAGEGEYFTIREIRQQAEGMINSNSSERSIEIETSKGRYTVVLEIPEINQVPVIKATTPSSRMAPSLPENSIVEERILSDYLYGWTIQKQRNELYGITDYSITQICDRLGFPNPSFFNRFVKKHFGMTPMRYRQQGTTIS